MHTPINRNSLTFMKTTTLLCTQHNTILINKINQQKYREERRTSRPALPQRRAPITYEEHMKRFNWPGRGISQIVDIVPLSSGMSLKDQHHGRACATLRFN